MIRTTDPIDKRKDRLILDTKDNYIDVIISIGHTVDGAFVREAEGAITKRIKDIPAHNEYKSEQLTVAAGVITASELPAASVKIFDQAGQPVDFTIDGQTITPTGVQDGDILTVNYHYYVGAVNRFSELAGKIITVDGIEMTAYDFISKYIDVALLDMGALSGEHV